MTEKGKARLSPKWVFPKHYKNTLYPDICKTLQAPLKAESGGFQTLDNNSLI